jgi:hypothetical protein
VRGRIIGAPAMVVVQAQDAAGAEHGCDAAQGDGFPEIGELVERTA